MPVAACTITPKLRERQDVFAVNNNFMSFGIVLSTTERELEKQTVTRCEDGGIKGE